MAGRTQHPGGCGPKQLGRPADGVLRKLTGNEALATGTTTTWFVTSLAGMIHLYAPDAGNTTKRTSYIRCTLPLPYKELEQFWDRQKR